MGDAIQSDDEEDEESTKEDREELDFSVKLFAQMAEQGEFNYGEEEDETELQVVLCEMVYEVNSS